jgi:adenine-specific DNA-methyltransferase
MSAMPTLDFKGKSFVYTHHLSVPFRELIVDAKKSELPKGAQPSLADNLVIHGDNLHALKALLPIYAGKVDCIYIDPPYNTGNEGWCYNDNVRSPLMKEWLKKSANPVEKDDLERHEKWLCMMWPRLKLLHELLAEDGAIFISIDDNEVHRLMGMLDEIFGEINFVTTIAWHKRISPANDALFFSTDHDHILVYAKKRELWKPKRIPLEGNQLDYYSNPDNDSRGSWNSAAYTCAKTAEERPNLYYAISNPNTKEQIWPSKTRVWAYEEATHKKHIQEKMIWWGKDGHAKMPRLKIFLGGRDVVPRSIWSYGFAGHNQEAKLELMKIFPNGDFNTPKPVRLIERILDIATDENSLVLDSFAGSATTAHAVLALNKKDGGNRKFILVETEDYADKLTAERVRRVINGYKFEGTQREELMREPITLTALKNAGALLEKANSFDLLDKHRFDRIAKSVEDGALVVTGEKKVTEKTEGLGGSFTFCTLGEEMSMDRLLAGGKLPSFDALAKYVFYTATGRTLADVPKQKADGDGFIGATEFYRVHLHYQPEKKWLASNDAALTEQLVEKMLASDKEKKRLLVFAPAKFMSQKELTRQGVEFCQLPYSIHRILGD